MANATLYQMGLGVQNKGTSPIILPRTWTLQHLPFLPFSASLPLFPCPCHSVLAALSFPLLFLTLLPSSFFPFGAMCSSVKWTQNSCCLVLNLWPHEERWHEKFFGRWRYTWSVHISTGGMTGEAHVHHISIRQTCGWSSWLCYMKLVDCTVTVVSCCVVHRAMITAITSFQHSSANTSPTTPSSLTLELHLDDSCQHLTPRTS